ncbi:hypothetical protein COCSADRAFT_328223 [Bipolaris sorokiniana ND90Pr]|uniref:Uncharacterized protein n=1 Tax=Cochliobolus sativus (strain ND90Pr / ATCC 201652) TaxID=665912 RepID=M2T2N1_COCSN|nr:uncharacterized protein COCSADRAFT_328223 [Bipolaris sorokiniana ND90Pr]EMD63461.1 hypothetical protein COCSADRAFT_328223 [Bipolaris sorokiniana ND90Pr]
MHSPMPLPSKPLSHGQFAIVKRTHAHRNRRKAHSLVPTPPQRSLSHFACPTPEPRQRPFLLPPLSLQNVASYVHSHRLMPQILLLLPPPPHAPFRCHPLPSSPCPAPPPVLQHAQPLKSVLHSRIMSSRTGPAPALASLLACC